MVLITGCSAVVDDSDGAAEGGDETLRASVSVRRTDAVSAGHHEVRTHVAARFLRAQGGLDEATAEQVVEGGALDAAAPLGCTWREDASVGRAAGIIELLDVGEIVLHAQGRQMALAPRAFPDVGGLISGVVYTSRDGRAELPDAATYLFEVSGSVAFDGFSIQTEAPSAPDDVRLGATPLDSMFAVVRVGEAAELSWRRPRSGAESDRIFVTVSSELDGDAFTCVFEDDGHAVIPGSFVGFEPGAELDVMIHRHRRARVSVPGEAYDAVVDFDFAVAARVAVAE